MRFVRRKRTRFARRATKRKATRRFKTRVRRVLKSTGIMPELKVAATTKAGGTISNNAPGQDQLTLQNSAGLGFLTVGTGRSNRIGDKIMISEIAIRFTSHIISGATRDAPLRVALIYDPSPEGVQFVTTDVWSTGAAAGETFNVSRNPYTRHQYRILYDRTYDHKLAFNSGAGNAIHDTHTWTIRKKFKKPLLVSYYPGAVAGTISDIQFGNLVLWFSAGGLTSNQISVSVVTYHLAYYDA